MQSPRKQKVANKKKGAKGGGKGRSGLRAKAALIGKNDNNALKQKKQPTPRLKPSQTLPEPLTPNWVLLACTDARVLRRQTSDGKMEVIVVSREEGHDHWLEVTPFPDIRTPFTAYGYCDPLGITVEGQCIREDGPDAGRIYPSVPRSAPSGYFSFEFKTEAEGGPPPGKYTLKIEYSDPLESMGIEVLP